MFDPRFDSANSKTHKCNITSLDKIPTDWKEHNYHCIYYNAFTAHMSGGMVAHLNFKDIDCSGLGKVKSIHYR